MTNESSQPTNVGSNDQLGLVAERAALGATSESDAYQQWLSENGESTRLGVASFGWLAWSAAVDQCRDAMADAARFRWLDEVALSVDMVADPDNLVQVWHETLSGHATTGRTLREAVDEAMKRHNDRGEA